MTRHWVSDSDRRWVMACDETGCKSKSEPFTRQPPLEMFLDRGWFVARHFGDVCPSCLARGVRPSVEPLERQP